MSTAFPRSCALVVAGETSGEEHAAGLVGALDGLLDEPLEFFGSGGSRMQEAGVELLAEVSQLAAIGPAQALSRLPAYRRLFGGIVAEVERRRPRLAVLVDFPEFNLRLAARLKRMGVPVCYFIGPQLWAWRQGRMKQIRRWVDLMLVILPFEEDFYRSHGVKAHYVGNPTVHRLAGIESTRDRVAPQAPYRVALLPGSRRGEVALNLPLHLDAAASIASRLEARFEIARAPAVDSEQIESICRSRTSGSTQGLNVKIATEPAGRVLAGVDAAIVKSGTSTLEAMIMGTPFVMTYRLSRLSWWLLRPLVPVRRYCLANWVAGNDVVPEFVQHEARGDSIGDSVVALLQDGLLRRRMTEGLAEGRRRLGDRDAFTEAARQIRRRFFTPETKS